MADSSPSATHTLSFRLGDEEVVIRRIYEVVSIVNDILVAGWFIAGSILFFREATTTVGTWFFLIGSIQLMIRPAIRLTRHVHLKRLGSSAPGGSPGEF
ncbi:YrhK family protein [Microbacterium sp. NPDC077184]|uniref:YrhK family protein n=1 Tax=Microbacterium sp. NPDC077184 TaxID=3154764 RepID=UPI00343B148D